MIYNPPKGIPNIIYLDEDILVLEKPSGLLSVPGKAEAHKDCVENRIQSQHPKARIVHRLDMETSGLMVMAMNAKAHRHLGLQFERRKVEKTYIAKVWGTLKPKEGIVDQPLLVDWPNRPRHKVDHDNGKSAQTYWMVTRYENNTSHVELKPVTGRSHQLRVHMLFLGHPILSDALYAHEDALQAADRLMLHAKKLSFHHPMNGERIHFESLILLD